MKYVLVLSKGVQKQLKKIDPRYLKRVKSALVDIENNPYAGKKLSGELIGEWSYRVWPYRIVYEINNSKLTILVITIAHRQGVYK